MSSPTPAKVSLLNASNVDCSQFKPELLQRMDSLYAFYHKQWWCHRKVLNQYKFYNALFNGLALLLMAVGLVVGPVWNHHTLVACLTAVGTVVKGWSEFKKFSVKVGMCQFAYTTYAKALIELRTYAWCSLRGSRRLLDQDANPGRHHRGFHPAFAQTLHPSLPETICVPTSPRPMLRGRSASSSDECEVLDPTG